MNARIDATGMPNPEPWPEVDPREAPPSDSAAECALLTMCEIYPEQVGTLRLDGLLVFPEHRTIWQAMTRIHAREPGLNVGEFYIALRREMCAALCKQDHQGDRENCDGWKTLRVLDFGEHCNPFKDIPYWMGRLERVRDARQIISDSQEQAERAWRLDVDGARRVLFRSAAHARRGINPEVEIPF